jgi:hypothetical protein
MRIMSLLRVGLSPNTTSASARHLPFNYYRLFDSGFTPTYSYSSFEVAENPRFLVCPMRPE